MLEKQKLTGELAQLDPMRAVLVHKMSCSGRAIP